jgi:hypothetical protein
VEVAWEMVGGSLEGGSGQETVLTPPEDMFLNETDAIKMIKVTIYWYSHVLLVHRYPWPGGRVADSQMGGLSHS